MSVCIHAAAPQKGREPLRVAFMPDVHFHDVYAQFADGSFSGTKTGTTGIPATIRTMQAQLTSTRLFNENYFALLAALDDVVARGVKLVALPGDFSDDGQPVHMRGLREILEHYSREHGIEFFAAPGNHDPVRPFDSPGGEPDFLGPGGQEQRIFSKGMEECTGYDTTWAVVDTGRPLKTICTEEIKHLGYQGVMAELQDFGFYPKDNYLYWETPYSNYREYEFQRALEQADLNNRQYEICRQGTGGPYKRPNYSDCRNIPDASYLVEPVPGLWLLAIDANVYMPRAAEKAPAGTGFEGSGNAGYNRMLSHKAHVLAWIRQVVRRADKSGKQLIAFSHFPMAEFYDGQSDTIADLFRESKFQLTRRPATAVSQALADTGLKLHVGGHMHMNDTGVVHGVTGNRLVNVQAPSLAAYLPAYKLMTLHPDKQVEVQTVLLDSVPRFNELFGHYRLEHETLETKDTGARWNKAILQSGSYREFTEWHIRELTRQRFLPSEWPEDLKQLLFSMNGLELLVLSQLQHGSLPENAADLKQLKNSVNWREAEARAAKRVEQAELKLSDFGEWNGFDLAVDFYRLRNAGSLAMRDIGSVRLRQYWLLTGLAARGEAEKDTEQPQPAPVVVGHRFQQFLLILDGLQRGAPNDHFMINLGSGEIQDLAKPM